MKDDDLNKLNGLNDLNASEHGQSDHRRTCHADLEWQMGQPLVGRKEAEDALKR